MPWFERYVKTGKRRIMGIGHRVYKANDPRAGILKRHAEALANSSGQRKWFDIAVKLEKTARADDYFIQRNLISQCRLLQRHSACIRSTWM